MPALTFGTAQLYDLQDGVQPAAMLEEAWRVGFRRFDTAPQYGGGRSEQDVGAFLPGHPGIEVLTTKAGLLPGGKRPLLRRVASRAKRSLPAPVVERLRDTAGRLSPEAPAQRELYSGRFTVPAITASIEESLRRLGGRIDRLLLHEVRPHDVTPELMELMGQLVARGDVGAVGVATQNHDTAESLAAGGELLTIAQYAVGLLDEPVELPAHVTTNIGFGLLGGGGQHLRRLRGVLASDPELAERWRAATEGTEFEGEGGVASALLARVPSLDVTDVIVGTTRLGNVARSYATASRTEPLPTGIANLLTELAAGARTS